MRPSPLPVRTGTGNKREGDLSGNEAWRRKALKRHGDARAGAASAAARGVRFRRRRRRGRGDVAAQRARVRRLRAGSAATERRGDARSFGRAVRPAPVDAAADRPDRPQRIVLAGRRDRGRPGRGRGGNRVLSQPRLRLHDRGRWRRPAPRRAGCRFSSIAIAASRANSSSAPKRRAITRWC